MMHGLELSDPMNENEIDEEIDHYQTIESQLTSPISKKKDLSIRCLSNCLSVYLVLNGIGLVAVLIYIVGTTTSNV